MNQNTIDTGLGVQGGAPGEGVMGVVSWLTPGKFGPGQLQPNARVQYGAYATSTTVVDVGLAYVIDGFNHKYHVNYRHADNEQVGGGSIGSDMIQLGFQYMMAK